MAARAREGGVSRMARGQRESKAVLAYWRRYRRLFGGPANPRFDRCVEPDWPGTYSVCCVDRKRPRADAMRERSEATGQRRLAEGNVMKRPVISWADGGEG